MNVRSSQAVAAANARTIGPALPETLRFVTDTRAIGAGDTFVALRGPTFDGHAFVREALAKGASALVVSDAAAVPENVPALVVADTTLAYLAFGGAARSSLHARVAAITGSAGKTTTKTFLAQILARATGKNVVATPANENNEIGVAKLLLGAPEDADYLVVEFGARHFGEIEPLARAARPDVALLTNVGEAHLEIMGSPERLAQTKWGIFATGARAVLNAADAVSLERSPSLSGPIVWYDARGAGRGLALGEGDRFVSLARVAETSPRDALTVARAGESASATLRCDVDVPGEHNRQNVVAAAAAAIALGAAPEAVAEALAYLTLPSGRYERIPWGDVHIIYDAYNASLSGTLATLASFAREPGERRIAVLGSMAELGDGAPAMHERVGAAAAAANLDALLVGGEYAPDLSRGARASGFDPAAIVPFASNAMAVAWLRANARPGDLVLLKGSRRYKLEEIVEGLRG